MQLTSKSREYLLFGSMGSSDIEIPPSKPFGSKKTCPKILYNFKSVQSPSKRQETSEYSDFS